MVRQASLEMPPHHQKQQHQKQQQHQHQQTDENSSPPLLGRHNQGVMVPADASTRSKQQQQVQQPSSDVVVGDRTVEPLIVFDWDDTILSSSWIQVNELLQAGSYDELPLAVRRDLAQLERSVIKCLKNARQLGTVIIITNAESGWVELSAARFFVDVLPLLEGVPVISARSLFEPQFPGSPLCWKSAAFAYMMHDHFLDRPPWVQKKVVSIGDSNEEKVAMRIASGQHGTMAAKAVKFITGPDPEALSCQLDYVTKNLASVVSSDHDVDIVLDASTIHGSYSLPLHSRGVYDDAQHQQPLSSSSPALSTPFSCRASSEAAAADRSPSSCATTTPTPARPASSPPACSTAPSSASLFPSPPDAAAGPAAAAAAPSPETARPSTAVSSSSSSSEGSAGTKREEPRAVDQSGRSRSSRGRNSTGAAGDATAGSSSSSSAPPSPQHLALKRRASSSPISIPPAGNGHGHGRVGGGGGNGSGGPGVEGGGDCAQPFPPSPIEVGGPLSSYSSLSRAAAAEGSALEVSSSSSSPSSGGSGSGDGEAMALSPASLVDNDGGRCVRGGDGGDGAEGGERRCSYGGGPPCPVDDRGRVGGGDGGSATVVVEMGGAAGPKEIAADDDGGQGRRGMMVFSNGGCGGEGARREAAADGMVGVVEGTVVSTAPKA